MTHTFFINASSGTFERYRALVETELEKRTLLAPDLLNGESAYPIREWYGFKGEKRVYEHCADRMTEIMDSDKNVGEGFNLLVYIDLNEFPEYAAISEENASAKLHCRQALRRFLRAFVYHTLYTELEKRCSEPKETLLILDTGCEEIDLAEDPLQTNVYQRELLGLNEAFYEEYRRGEASAERFETLFLRENTENAFWQGIKDFYLPSMKLLFSDSVPEPNDDLLAAELSKTERYHYAKKVKTVLFEENRFATEKSMREYARVKIRLCVYLLQCVQRGTVSKTSANLGTDESVIGFDAIDMEAVKEILHRKYRLYDEEYRKFPSDGACAEIKKSFGRKIKKLPCERYGLDAYGTKAGNPKTPILSDLKISAEMKNYMGSDGETTEEEEAGKAEALSFVRIGSADELIAKASAVRKTHGEFSKILETGVNVLLSDYAQGSVLGDAKLSKRAPEEEKPRYLLDTEENTEFDKAGVKEFSEKAYRTAKEDYLKTNRVYDVAPTEIEEQYEWLTKRAKEIEESIRSLQTSLGVASLLLFCAYLPFFIIQWNLIFENLLTFGVALLTAAVPFVILVTVFGYLIRRERDGYAEVYREFLENARKSVYQNKQSWNAYIELLDTKIPALRYLYEYQTDIGGAFTAYRTDQGKCLHHREILQRRRETVGNLLEDLSEAPSTARAEPSEKLRVDYEKAFFCGKNAEFYAILTAEDIETITKGETR